ncbi:hypothetical protein XENTR_v10007895 [Xenopus tropicalis]|nr:hypothetical protein XENTR_v10007895 [Xenopus tropicalis]
MGDGLSVIWSFLDNGFPDKGSDTCMNKHKNSEKYFYVLCCSLTASGCLPQSCVHTSAVLERSRHWEMKNRIVYPPQLPDEPRRPAEVYHCRKQIKYSKDKMWYLAKLIRGMSVDQAIAQLEFNDKKGAKIMKEPFRGGFAGVFWVIVLLQHPRSLQLELTNRWPDILLQDFLVDGRVHGSIYHSKPSRS